LPFFWSRLSLYINLWEKLLVEEIVGERENESGNWELVYFVAEGRAAAATSGDWRRMNKCKNTFFKNL